MEYQKLANLSDARNWVEINDESRGTYTSNDISFKSTMPLI